MQCKKTKKQQSKIQTNTLTWNKRCSSMLKIKKKLNGEEKKYKCAKGKEKQKQQ